MANVVDYQTNSRQLRLEARLGELEVELRDGGWAFPSSGGRITDPGVAKFAQQLLDMTRQDAEDHVPDEVVSVLMAGWGLATAGMRRAAFFPLDLMRR